MGTDEAVGGAASTKMSNNNRKLAKTLIATNKHVVKIVRQRNSIAKYDTFLTNEFVTLQTLLL